MPEDPDADDPLAVVGSVARWRFVHDEPEERGGGSVAGEFLLRLYQPSPVPIDEETAGPFPGVPDVAEPI